MASGIYAKAKKKWLDADIDLLVDTIKAVLVKIDGGSPYTVNFTTDEFLSAIPVSARIATSAALTGKTTTDGVFDANDTLFTAVIGGTVAQAVVLIRDTGNAATSALIAYIDNYTNLPVTTNGNDINVAWDNGVNKIFKL